MTLEDYIEFINTLEDPPDPNDKLLKAYQRYREVVDAND